MSWGEAFEVAVQITMVVVTVAVAVALLYRTIVVGGLLAPAVLFVSGFALLVFAVHRHGHWTLW